MHTGRMPLSLKVVTVAQLFVVVVAVIGEDIQLLNIFVLQSSFILTSSLVSSLYYEGETTNLNEQKSSSFLGCTLRLCQSKKKMCHKLILRSQFFTLPHTYWGLLVITEPSGLSCGPAPQVLTLHSNQKVLRIQDSICAVGFRKRWNICLDFW